MSVQAYHQSLETKGYDAPVEKTWTAHRLNDTHTHDVDLYLYILDGEMTVSGPGYSTVCRPGDTIEVPGSQDHVEQVGDQGVRFLVATRPAGA
ncbi:cupin domain-containing protein [Caenispirillum salinarum]|uniref:cupin domain-containing protein n=1 Tax=Caenispirillum salinarum TaxID=859058 RepID=UPI00384A914A